MNVSNYKKNFLKDLIYLAHTKPVNKQIIKGLFRFALEPLLEAQNQKAVVLIRMFDTKDTEGVLKRLEFNQAEVYSFCENVKGENLERENVWGDTEFLVILSPRYSVVLLWDYSTEENGETSCVYYLLNSRDVNNVIRIISSNSKIDLGRYIVEYTPERRTNELLNKSVHKLIDFANDYVSEATVSKAENNVLESNEELLKKYEYISNKAKMISHEIRNHLSVIDLYSKIIEKRAQNIEASESRDSIKNGIFCINKSKTAVTQLLSELKTIQGADLMPIKLNEILKTLGDLVHPRTQEKNAVLNIKNSFDCDIFADENKLLNVLINLVYNALEALNQNEKEQKSCRIEIETYIEGENMLKILVKDNGCGISEDRIEKIFEEGYSSKISGSGLGLFISKSTMQQQYGDLTLKESSKEGTTFEILIPIFSI